MTNRNLCGRWSCAGRFSTIASVTTQDDTRTSPAYRFSGHQTFALRIAWLSKAAQAIEAGKDPFGNPLTGVVELGLGKVMVEALRCWVEAYGVAERRDSAWVLTDEGAAIFGKHGHDRYLEDGQTLWWLHWRISTLRQAPFFAWELLVNRWNAPTFTPSEVLREFAREAERTSRDLSDVTAKQHLDVWIRTYCAPREGRVLEDGIDSPLTALGFVRQVGEREGANRREPLYAFDQTPKRAITQALFHYCLTDWWLHRDAKEETAPFRDVVTAPLSPGRVLRMGEAEVRDRLLKLQADPTFPFQLAESLNQYQLRQRHNPMALSALLADAYRTPTPLVVEAANV